MHSRSAAAPAAFSQRAAAMRRLRRRPPVDRLYCRTNGCTTYLEPDLAANVATCPVCGYTRPLPRG